MKVQRFTRLYGGKFGQYVHHDGTLGVLIQVKGEKADAKCCATCAAAHRRPEPAVRRGWPTCRPTSWPRRRRWPSSRSRTTRRTPEAGQHPREDRRGQAQDLVGENVLIEQPIANQAKYDKKTRRPGPPGRPGWRWSSSSGTRSAKWRSENTHHLIRGTMPHTASAAKRLRKTEKRRRQQPGRSRRPSSRSGRTSQVDAGGTDAKCDGYRRSSRRRRPWTGPPPRATSTRTRRPG